MEDQERRKRLVTHFADQAQLQEFYENDKSKTRAVMKLPCKGCSATKIGGDLCASCLRLVTESLERTGCTIGKPYLAPPVTIEEDESLEGKK